MNIISDLEAVASHKPATPSHQYLSLKNKQFAVVILRVYSACVQPGWSMDGQTESAIDGSSMVKPDKTFGNIVSDTLTFRDYMGLSMAASDNLPALQG